ncbi:hypothetical protein KY290_033109 [Solanum tuberosum]|uniref:Uncharacterized protein n=1 Tax=Solanum tuberosum TaxID=4113 RepID=A0ABQ7TZC0_SOLTU|nr:hypothetical protein KY285_032356 [Solanum tuberosum]KAH0740066.1 hypothetical protein KY290_033109 [Solanum tuberosum]
MDGTARRYIGVHVAEATKCLQRYRTLHRKFCNMWRRMCRDTSILLDMPYDLEKEQVEEQPYEGVYGRRYVVCATSHHHLCTSCILKSHASSFCSICFDAFLHNASSPSPASPLFKMPLYLTTLLRR